MLTYSHGAVITRSDQQGGHHKCSRARGTVVVDIKYRHSSKTKTWGGGREGRERRENGGREGEGREGGRGERGRRGEKGRENDSKDEGKMGRKEEGRKRRRMERWKEPNLTLTINSLLP